jgi:PAS domain S-box-containing protein
VLEQSLNILIIEDNPSDFLLIERHLRHQGMRVMCSRVDTAAALERALDAGSWDLILSDFNTPLLNFYDSFAQIKSHTPDLPVILVSGFVGEEQAIELLKLGVTDFVLKDNMVRLVPSIERALKESEERRARRVAEVALRESEERFRLFMDNSPTSAWVKDEQGQYLYWSKGFEQRINVRLAEWRGKTDEELWPREIAGEYYRHDLEVLKAGHPQEVTEETRNTDGSRCTWLVSKFPFSDATGNRYVGGIGLDITARVRAEELVARTRDHYLSILKYAPALIWRSDTEAKCDWFNDAWLEFTGRTMEQEYGDGWAAGVHPEDLDRCVTTYREAFTKQNRFSMEYRLRHHTGEYRWILDIGQPYRQLDDSFAGYIGYCFDITERKQREQELMHTRNMAEAASRFKSAFLADLSHEIRTPLNAIIGLGDLALHTNLTPQQQDYLTKIGTAAKSLFRYINDTLDFSRIEAGKLVLEHIDFSLKEILDRINALFGVLAREKGLELLNDIDRQIPESLVGDPLRLEQVLINLIGNALKFTHEGEVVLTASLLETNEASRQIVLCFSVKDSGIGMSSGQIESLFQPFTQADSSTTRCYGGSGLGLSICRNLVELMGGAIGAEGEPGRGSTFTFTATFGLSARTVPLPAQRGTCAVVAPKPEALRGARILLVEDQDINQQVARENLEGLGITVELARNGREAVELMAQRGDRFDGILMDIQMPVMDGYEATRLIRKQWPIDRLPIIAMTAHVQAADREKCLQVGMNDHIAKPVDKADLYRCLLTWVRPRPCSAEPAAPDASRGDRREEQPTALPGFAVVEGLARLNGNMPLYHKLIIAFNRDKGHSAAEIAAALAVPDLKHAHFLAHTLRGVAGNLGASGIYATACTIANACTRGETEAVRGLLPILETKLAEVRATAALLEESTSNGKPGKTAGEFAPDAALALLRELDTLVAVHDLRALDRIDHLQELLAGTGFAPLGALLAETLDRMDFEAASRHLATLTARVAHREGGESQ